MRLNIAIFGILLVTIFSITSKTEAKVNTETRYNDSCTFKVDRAYFMSYLPDFKNLVISPTKWDKTDIIIASSVAATTTFLYFHDEEITTYFQSKQSVGLDNANKYFFDPFGKMYYTVPLMGAMYLYGQLGNKQKPKVVAMDFVKASVFSGLIVTGIKHIAHRHRPFQTSPLNNKLWDGPLTDNWEHTSFPSGHTIMSFTFASVLAEHYKDRLWVPITVYSLATASGLARIYAQKHWSTDVVVGAALGYAIGKFVVRNSNCNSKLSISTSGTGFGVRYQI